MALWLQGYTLADEEEDPLIYQHRMLRSGQGDALASGPVETGPMKKLHVSTINLQKVHDFPRGLGGCLERRAQLFSLLPSSSLLLPPVQNSQRPAQAFFRNSRYHELRSFCLFPGVQMICFLKLRIKVEQNSRLPWSSDSRILCCKYHSHFLREWNKTSGALP